MNWKNILYLLRVERKSGRLIRGIKATRYRENSFIAYWPYWTAAIIGILGGIIANYGVSIIYKNGAATTGIPPLSVAALSFFAVLPTLVLVFSLIFTLLQQIQLAGLKASSQVMYWLPVTWQEHTLASILANLLGWPVALVVGLTSGLIIFSIFNGLVLQGLLTVVILFAAAFMASSITETLRILQVRFTGAVYKSSGRGAIWVRFIGSILFFIIFYLFYFYVTSGFTTFITNLTSVQNAYWYVPFVWLALLLSYTVNGLFLQGIFYLALSIVFIAALYYLAVYLNRRFGLYEPPAIRVQKSGVYSPKAGVWGKFGFSDVEAALIGKDLKSFTRRRELIGVFIPAIIFIIVPLLNSFGVVNGGTAPTGQSTTIFLWIIFVGPPAFMAMLLGEVSIGEEGQSMLGIYASPISAKALVKSKYFLIVLFAAIILLISGTVGIIFYHPTIQDAIVAFVATFFLIIAASAISLTIGLKGPDFSVTRRARMIRQEWSLIGLVACTLGGAVVFAPLVPYLLFRLFNIGFSFNIVISTSISAVISAVITVVFYRINIGLADNLLKKAQI